jgi:broad specificity phosphatase PhoE
VAKLYFVRHGESEANLRQEFSNRGTRHGLTEWGRQQVETLAERLQRLDVIALFSSPLLRAIQTAEVLAQTFAASYETTAALREYDCGVLEGKSDQASWKLYETVLEDWFQHSRWESRIEGGESFLDIRNRFIPFVEQILKTHEHNSGDLVLVGHGGIYRCMLPLILSNVNFDFVLSHPLGYSGYVVAESGPAGLVCSTWVETVLPEAPLADL